MYASKGLMLFFMLLLFAFSHLAIAQPSAQTWSCKASDSSGKVWAVKKSFKRLALNQALESCKRQSSQPTTCKVAKEWCETNIAGQQFSHTWMCKAFDQMGEMWAGKQRYSRQDAVDSAKDLCQQFSVAPQSCYVRLMACSNSHN